MSEADVLRRGSGKGLEPMAASLPSALVRPGGPFHPTVRDDEGVLSSQPANGALGRAGRSAPFSRSKVPRAFFRLASLHPPASQRPSTYSPGGPPASAAT